MHFKKTLIWLLLRHYFIVLQHKWYVFKCGRELGVGYFRLIIHDWSKFMFSEAIDYAKWFGGDKSNPDGFAKAWLHHQNTNKHHWEYWLTRSGKGVEPGTIVPLFMPRKYVREMIADWMAASISYAKTKDMSEWLKSNWYKINLHPESKEFAKTILFVLGYQNVINNIEH